MSDDTILIDQENKRGNRLGADEFSLGPVMFVVPVVHPG